MTCIIVMGVSGSGKSSVGAGVANMLGLPFLEGDSLHSNESVAKMESGIPLQDADRWPWLSQIGEQLAASETGIVISCSALKKTYRNHLREKAGKPLLFIFLDGSYEILHEHMRQRTGHFMPVGMLESQIAALEPPLGEPHVFHANVEHPVAAIIDESAIWARSEMAKMRATY